MSREEPPESVTSRDVLAEAGRIMTTSGGGATTVTDAAPAAAADGGSLPSGD
jgi:hypothetical protein